MNGEENVNATFSAGTETAFLVSINTEYSGRMRNINTSQIITKAKRGINAIST